MVQMWSATCESRYAEGCAERWATASLNSAHSIARWRDSAMECWPSKSKRLDFDGQSVAHARLPLAFTMSAKLDNTCVNRDARYTMGEIASHPMQLDGANDKYDETDRATASTGTHISASWSRKGKNGWVLGHR